MEKWIIVLELGVSASHLVRNDIKGTVEDALHGGNLDIPVKEVTVHVVRKLDE